MQAATHRRARLCGRAPVQLCALCRSAESRARRGGLFRAARHSARLGDSANPRAESRARDTGPVRRLPRGDGGGGIVGGIPPPPNRREIAAIRSPVPGPEDFGRRPAGGPPRRACGGGLEVRAGLTRCDSAWLVSADIT